MRNIMDIKPVFTFPEAPELSSRIERVRAEMVKQNLDYYVAQCPDNVFYLTNFYNYVHERPFVLVVPLSGSLKFVVPKLEIPHVLSRKVGDIDLVEYFEFPAPEGQTWADRFKEIFSGSGKVGVESICPLQVYEEVPGTPVRTDIVDDVRQVKSDYEISRIKYSSDIASDGMTALMKAAKPGQTLLSISSTIAGQMMGNIIKDNPATNLLCTSFHSVFHPANVSHDPHNFTDIAMSMEEGGPHVCVINGIANGYGTEIERTYFLGHVPENALKPFEVMMEARRKAFELTVAGNIMHDVDETINGILKKAGYENNLLHRTGHGIGVTGHEGPFLAEGYHREIQPGMIFTIEPGIYIEGLGGFRHSDTVLVTEEGNISLTQYSDQIEELTLAI